MRARNFTECSDLCRQMTSNGPNDSPFHTAILSIQVAYLSSALPGGVPSRIQTNITEVVSS